MVMSLAAPTAAHESRVRHTDPHEDGLVDVWSSAKVTIHEGPHDHRVRFKVHGNPYADWYIYVLVDSRRGDRADYKLWSYEDLGTSGCGGRRLFHEEIELNCRRVLECCYEVWLRWTIERKVLRPDKRIRWRVITYYPGADPYPGPPEDLAPDSGWYR